MVSTQPNGNGVHHDEAAPAETGAGAGAVSQEKGGLRPHDVGWQFVPQYYQFVSSQPHRLHCFYNKRSAFTHGEEGEESQPALGQQEIHERISAIGYEDTKVYIHSIDTQSSQNGSVVILVIGEMSRKAGPWRKFIQTVVLAEQPGGYFVLNDIFRFLKEDGADAEEEEEEEEGLVAEQSQAEVAPVAQETEAEVAPVSEQPASEAIPEEEEVAAPAADVGSGPEPTNEPAHPDPTAVPEEAEVAAVADKDVAPTEAAPAEETAVAPEQVEETPAAEETAPIKANGDVSSSVVEAAAPAAPAQPAAAPAAPTPAAPAKPAAPKTWATMAAKNAPKPAPAAAAPVTVAAPVKAEASAPAPAAAAAAPAAEASQQQQQPQQSGRNHPYYENAMNVQTSHCFVKLPNWLPTGAQANDSIDMNTVKQVASRFGEVVSAEAPSGKACAFLEFKTVDAARKAIVASLTPQQGGQGGVRVPSGGVMYFETRKDKDHPARQKNNGPRGGGGGGGGAGAGGAGRGGRGVPRMGGGDGQQRGEYVERGGARGGRGGRGGGRGGFQGQGERGPK